MTDELYREVALWGLIVATATLLFCVLGVQGYWRLGTLLWWLVFNAFVIGFVWAESLIQKRIVVDAAVQNYSSCIENGASDVDAQEDFEGVVLTQQVDATCVFVPNVCASKTILE